MPQSAAPVGRAKAGTPALLCTRSTKLLRAAHVLQSFQLLPYLLDVVHGDDDSFGVVEASWSNLGLYDILSNRDVYINCHVTQQINNNQHKDSHDEPAGRAAYKFRGRR